MHAFAMTWPESVFSMFAILVIAIAVAIGVVFMIIRKSVRFVLQPVTGRRTSSRRKRR